MDLTITGEFLVVIIINVLCGGIYLGSLVAAIKFIEKQIERLEIKQDKHNSVIERTYCCEQSLKAEHNRLDEMKEEISRLSERVYK